MTFQISWTESSYKRLQKLDSLARKRIVEKLDEVADNPFAFAKKLTGINLYSIRVGDYRVIVSIEKNKLLILVIDIGHRSTIYKQMR